MELGKKLKGKIPKDIRDLLKRDGTLIIIGKDLADNVKVILRSTPEFDPLPLINLAMDILHQTKEKMLKEAS